MNSHTMLEDLNKQVLKALDDFNILNINLFNGRIFHEDKAVNIELILKAIATFF